MTAAQEPRAGEVLTAESVKLLRAGDVFYFFRSRMDAGYAPATAIFVNDEGVLYLGHEGRKCWADVSPDHDIVIVSRPSESSASVGGEAFVSWLERLADDASMDVGAAHQEGSVATTQEKARAFVLASLVKEAKEHFALRTQAPAREGERITTAAIQHSSGIIVTVERPGRHGECINFLNRCGLEYKEGHGFLTSHGRFVDRQQAAVIAVEAGQGSPRPQCNGNLFSEDLWSDAALSRQHQEGEGRE